MKLIGTSQTTVIVLFMCLELGFCAVFGVKYVEELQSQSSYSETTGHIHCSCDNTVTSKDIPEDRLQQIFRDLRKTSLCEGSDSDEICLLINKCRNCMLEMTECEPPGEERQRYNCYKRQAIIFGDGINENLKLDTYGQKSNEVNGSESVYDLLTRSRRKRRQLAFCPFPHLKTADVVCQKYPSTVKCTEKCIFGYTLKEGIARKMQCVYSDNKWEPKGFQECHPFIDCTMTLLSAGKMSCTTATTRAAPECNVTCFDFEDKRKTKDQTFKCLINGSWDRQLPFCVTSGSGLELVSAPNVRLHRFTQDDSDKETTKRMKGTKVTRSSTASYMKRHRTRP